MDGPEAYAKPYGPPRTPFEARDDARHDPYRARLTRANPGPSEQEDDTMKVRVKTGEGLYYEAVAFAPGEELDVPPSVAQIWFDGGLAEEVNERRPKGRT
jgi:hypothetical protein